MRILKKVSAFLTGTIFALTALASTVFAAPGDTQSEVDWEKGVVRAVGLGAGKSGEKRVGILRAQARRAATMDAERNLAEQVQGVQVTADSTMRDLELEYDVVKTHVEAIIKNMKVIKETFYEDGTCEVVMEMPLFGSSNSVAQAAFLPFKDEAREPFPQPTNITATTVTTTETTALSAGTVVASAVSGPKHTGLIVNCTGLGLKPVMSPVIRNNNGQAIYGYKNLNPDYVIANGMASYTRDINDQTRAGNNPLVVMAVAVENHDAYPVVTISDADSVLIANQADGFLDNCAVVFVR